MPGYAFVHDFALTQSYYLLCLNPVRLDLGTLLKGASCVGSVQVWPHLSRPWPASQLSLPSLERASSKAAATMVGDSYSLNNNSTCVHRRCFCHPTFHNPNLLMGYPFICKSITLCRQWLKKPFFCLKRYYLRGAGFLETSMVADEVDWVSRLALPSMLLLPMHELALCGRRLTGCGHLHVKHVKRYS